MTAALKLDLSPRKFAAILLATTVVLAGAAWFLAVGPKRSEASKLQATIQTKQSEIASAEQERAASTQRVSAGAGQLLTAMPTEAAMPQVLDELNALAGKAGVTLDTVTPATAVPGTGYTAIPLSVVVDGRFFPVQRFLALVRTRVETGKTRLRASGRLFDIQSVQLVQTEPAPSVTATLGLRAFYLSSQAAPAAAVEQTATTAATGT